MEAVPDRCQGVSEFVGKEGDEVVLRLIGLPQFAVDPGVFFFQAEDGIRVRDVTGVQTCALPISPPSATSRSAITRSAPTWSSAWPRWLAPPCATAARTHAAPNRKRRPKQRTLRLLRRQRTKSANGPSLPPRSARASLHLKSRRRRSLNQRQNLSWSRRQNPHPSLSSKRSRPKSLRRLSMRWSRYLHPRKPSRMNPGKSSRSRFSPAGSARRRR